MRRDPHEQFRRHAVESGFLPGPERTPPVKAPEIAPHPDDVADLRARLRELPEEHRRWGEVDLPKQVAWLNDAMLGLNSRHPRFIQDHPDLIGLFRRMVLRAVAQNDTASEQQLLELALKYQGIL